MRNHAKARDYRCKAIMKARNQIFSKDQLYEQTNKILPKQYRMTTLQFSQYKRIFNNSSSSHLSNDH